VSNALLDAYRAQVAGLHLARTQSNEIIGKLMGAKLDEAQRKELFDAIIRHCNEQEASRSAQLEAVMRTALMQLNAIAQSTGDALAKQELAQVISALTLTVECASAAKDFPTPPTTKEENA